MVAVDNKILKLEPDWGAWPVWVQTDWGFDNVDPMSFGLKDETLSALQSWDDWFHSAYNPNDPRESGFKSESERERFQHEGREIAQRVATDLGNGWRVDLAPYSPDGVWESFYPEGP